jgi:hypothetical protein
VRQALITVCGLLVAALALCGSLWQRDRDAMRDADRLRASADARASVCVTARGRALATLAEMEAVALACPARVADGERQAVEDERRTCEQLLHASEARGRLAVPTSDLDTIVAVLRARRR